LTAKKPFELSQQHIERQLI